MLNELQAIVGDKNILHSGKEKERFTHIWKTDIPLEALAIVFPTSTQEVAASMKLCHSKNEEVLVHGGLTY